MSDLRHDVEINPSNIAEAGAAGFNRIQIVMISRVARFLSSITNFKKVSRFFFVNFCKRCKHFVYFIEECTF